MSIQRKWKWIFVLRKIQKFHYQIKFNLMVIWNNLFHYFSIFNSFRIPCFSSSRPFIPVAHGFVFLLFFNFNDKTANFSQHIFVGLASAFDFSFFFVFFRLLIINGAMTTADWNGFHCELFFELKFQVPCLRKILVYSQPVQLSSNNFENIQLSTVVIFISKKREKIANLESVGFVVVSTSMKIQFLGINFPCHLSTYKFSHRP